MGLPVFNSDPFFRKCRALPKGTTDPLRQIMVRFLERVAVEFPDRLAAVRADADGVDEHGRCLLHDGKIFRGHGEHVFRAYEIEMLQWTHAHGVLRDQIPDLSASATLFEENRRIFSLENGYLPVLVDTPIEAICRNLIDDYATVDAERARGNAAFTIRGGYEKLFDEALKRDSILDAQDRRDRLVDVAMCETARAAAKRLIAYRAFATRSITPATTAKPEDSAIEVLALLKGADDVALGQPCNTL
jgi:hypothetical protein